MSRIIQSFMAFFYKHFYHGLSWTYDFVAAVVSVGRWRDWGRTVLPHLRGIRVLELGFGPGHLQSALTAAGFQAIGLDESRQMCRQAFRNIRQNGFNPALFRGYAQYLPFASESFDSLTATFPSEYIVEAETLAEAGRVLKPGGRLVIALSALPGQASLADRAASWLFEVTGQGGMVTDNLEERVKAYFETGQFKVSLIREQVRQSTVILVVAEKLNSAKVFQSTE